MSKGVVFLLANENRNVGPHVADICDAQRHQLCDPTYTVKTDADASCITETSQRTSCEACTLNA